MLRILDGVRWGVSASLRIWSSALAFGFAKVQMTDSLDRFIDDYQSYEALVVKEQVEYLRQRKYRPIASMYHYYWNDPCPMMGSGLLDYYRRLTRCTRR